MARPRKTGLDYFPHDCTASHDTKLEAMELEHGLEGYAFYFKLLERIYSENGLNLRNPASYGACVKGMGVGKEKFDAMLHTALSYGLFEADTFEDTGEITSDSIRKRINAVNSRRVSATETTQKPYDNATDCEVSAEFPSREKKSKEKKSKVVVPACEEDNYGDGPSEEDVQAAVNLNLAISEVEDAAKGIGLTVADKQLDMINLYLADHPKDWVLKAIEQTAKAPKPSWFYLESVLKGYREHDGPDTPGNARASPQEGDRDELGRVYFGGVWVEV